MNKLFTKIAGVVLGLTLTIGVGLGVGSNKEAMPVHASVGDDVTIGSSTYESAYETGFENAKTGTTYNSTQTYDSTAGNGAFWSVYYGTVSTTSKITGSNSMHMRWYATAKTNYPHAETTSSIASVKAFKFNYAVGNKNVGFKVQYGTDGSNWTDIETVKPANTSVAVYSHEFDSAVSTFYFRVLVCLGTAPSSGYYTFRIDDVVFGKEKSSSTAVLERISASSTQTEVYQGEELDTSAITVTGYYDDDTEGPLAGGWTVACDTSTIANNVTATVTHTASSLTATFTVNVVAKPAELDVTISNFTEISTTYGNYSHTYTGLNDLNGGTTGSVTIYANQVYKSGNGIQTNSGKNCYINNTTAFPGRILSVTATFTASGRNTTTMYASYGSAATASSTKIGDGSNSVTEQVFDFSDGNYNYFYFDLSNVTGAVWCSLHIEYGNLMPEVTSSTYEETIYTSNNGGAATSFVATLTYSNFTSVEDVNVISSNTSIIPVENCVLSNSNTTLTVTGNAVAGSSTITVEAMDSDTEVYTCEIEVAVLNNSSSVSKIEVTTQPTKTSYTEGDALDLTGLVITATYSDETTSNVTEDCTFSPADGAALALSDTTVSVSYTFSGKTVNTSFALTISEMPRYTLVTDITQLTEGAKVLIAGENSGTTYVAKKYVSGNNVGAVAATLNDGKVIKTSEMSTMTIGTNSNGYTIKDEGDKYFYAASSSGNHMKGQASASINAYWNITYSEGAFSITAHKSENRNVMQFNYNNGSPIFSCYASASQSAVQLYVLDTNPSAADKLNTFGRLFLNSVENTLVTEETGVQGTACVDDGTYLAAKSALAGAWSCVKSDLQNDTTGLALRYEAWARAAGDADPYDGNSNIQSTIRNQLIALTENNNIAILIIVIASSMTLVAGVIVFKRKKNQLSK